MIPSPDGVLGGLPASTRLPRPLLSLARSLALRVLRSAPGLDLAVQEGARSWRIGPGADPVRLVVHDARLWAAMLLEGSAGAGRSYAEGWWDSDDLPGLVQRLAGAGAALERWRSGPARLVAPLQRALHRARRNDLRGSRRNIAAHYDLGNDFFARWLDPSMMYSCATWLRAGDDLAQAQRDKLDRIGRKLRLSPADHVLEIGTGWGGFALHAARSFGCRVTTTTISAEQFAVAQRRVRRAGLEGQVELLQQDYRQLSGHYDKLVSIEMVEAVGAEYLDLFLGVCRDRLRPGGQALLQAIVIDDRHYDAALRSVDFIKRYIFPGSFIPSVGRIVEGLGRVGGLAAVHAEELGPHYARTLAAWRERFDADEEWLDGHGYDRRFRRLWRFYLAYCGGGFAARRIGDVQLVLQRAGGGWERPWLPALPGGLEAAHPGGWTADGGLR